MSIDLV